jgi:hypothetical protein
MQLVKLLDEARGRVQKTACAIKWKVRGWTVPEAADFRF